MAERVTNADRIRAMSDEELAELLCDTIARGICELCAPEDFDCYGACFDCMVLWLQQPAKEDA